MSYKIVGWAKGRFEDETGKMKDYASLYVTYPVSNYTSDDYEAMGMKAEKMKCVSAGVFSKVNIGDQVELYFDEKKRVNLIMPISKEKDKPNGSANAKLPF